MSYRSVSAEELAIRARLAREISREFQRRRLTRSWLAEMHAISPRTAANLLSEIRSGEGARVSTSTLIAIANRLRIDVRVEITPPASRAAA